MIDAVSLSKIKNNILRKIKKTKNTEGKDNLVVLPAVIPASYSELYMGATKKCAEENQSELIGILFCRPDTPLAEEEIIKSLQYFHTRSGGNVDFYCVGYGAYWQPSYFPDQRPVTKIDGAQWFFSEQAFCQFLGEIERESAWEYSGETELILVDAKENEDGSVELKYESAIVCNLEKMFNDKAFTSVRNFFESLFRKARTLGSTNKSWAMSDKMGVDVATHSLKELVLSVLPESVSSFYRKASHYAVRNISEK